MIKKYLYVGRVEGKGRGVFTSEKIDTGVVIEESPVIVMSADDRVELDKTLLHDYIFAWGTDESKCCMALGLVPVYNHSYKSNCEYFMDFEEETMQIKTVREIQPDEELTVNYNGNWDEEKRVWFDVI
ncbi:MAG: SET domain-containing protein [Ginsengibacter sp.]